MDEDWFGLEWNEVSFLVDAYSDTGRAALWLVAEFFN